MLRRLPALALACCALLAGCGSATATGSLAEPPRLDVDGTRVHPLDEARIGMVGGEPHLCLTQVGACVGPELAGLPAGTGTGRAMVIGRLGDDGDRLDVEDVDMSSAYLSVLVLGYDVPEACGDAAVDEGDGSPLSRDDEQDVLDAVAGVPGVLRVTSTGDAGATGPTVLAVWFHGDRRSVRDAVRGSWAGGMCLVESPRTQAELEDQVAELSRRLPGGLPSSGFRPGPANDALTVHVAYDDGTLQRWVDRQLGRGLVRVRPALVGDPGLDEGPP